MLLSSGESLSPDEIEAVRVRNAASMSSCRFPAFDQLLNFIAQDVRASIDGAPVGWEKVFYCLQFTQQSPWLTLGRTCLWH